MWAFKKCYQWIFQNITRYIIFTLNNDKMNWQMSQFYYLPPKGLTLWVEGKKKKKLTISLKSESIYLKSILRRENELRTLSFATTYLYEPEFPRHNAIKIKFRNKVDIQADIK